MQRSKSHVVVGLCFVLAAIVVAGGIYAGLVLSRTTTQAQTPVASQSAPAAMGQPTAEPVAQPEPESAAAEATPQSTTERMTGTFAQGIGSNAQCEGRMWRFMDDSTFRLTDAESDIATEGSWHVVEGTLYLTDMTQSGGGEEGTSSAVTDMTYTVSWNGDLLIIGKHEYVNCAPNSRI